VNPAPAAVHSAFSFFTSVNGAPLKDEYDPSKPNDYEEIVKERERKKQQAEEEAERLARMREIEQVQ
jgi:splicing factor 45